MKGKFTLLIVLVAIFATGASASIDDLATTIDLRGVPGPYSVHRFCRLSSPDIWSVAGGGQVNHETVNGRREFRPTTEDLNGVYFSSSTSGWVVGTLGTILRTQDAGEHWVGQDSRTKKELKAITCIGEDTCWIVGSSGTVLSTTDGGRYWKRMHVNTTDNLYALSFVNSRVGWAVGADGLILHTEDGGSSWTQQYLKMILFPDGPFAEPTDLRAVLFIDEHRGWVAGIDWIARTVDGGETWMTSNIKGSFIGLVSQDGVNVWAINDAASNETNYLSDDAGKTWKKWNHEQRK